MYDKKEIGKRIKKIRTDHGKTQEKFGELFSASKGNVATWEKGLSLPNNERLKMISEYAGISVNELLYNRKDNSKELNLKIFNEMLKKYSVDTHIGKALRFPNDKDKLDLLKAGINRTLTVPVLKNIIKNPEDILSQSLFNYIADEFLDFYIKNYKSNNNVISYVENGLSDLYNNLTRYDYYDFHFEIQDIFEDVTLIFSERENSVDTDLIQKLDDFLYNSIEKIGSLKEQYPDNPPNKQMNVIAITNNEPEILSRYSFDVKDYENEENKIEMIQHNLPIILEKLIEDNNDLYKYLYDKFKH